ncbi:MAG: hypothetical protein JWP97_2386 [Labilithrix sp.]|nr:hypothetical protein [Labilithrix sp.]
MGSSPAAAPSWRTLRTSRALARLGVPFGVVASAAALAEALAARTGPVWILREGAVPADPHRVPRVPAPSATGRSLLGFGAPPDDPAWTSFLEATAGNVLLALDQLPPVASVLVEAPAPLAEALRTGRGPARGWLARTAGSDPLALACSALAARVRAVRLPAFDVSDRAPMRVVELVTTLHRGGAERLVLDLSMELARLGVDVTLAVLDHATRTTFEAPPGTMFLDAVAASRPDRLRALGDLAIAAGADVLHAHLVNGEDLALLASAGIPVVTTIHNSEPGWPIKLGSLRPGDLGLVIACSRDVERQLLAAGLPAPVRTVWNGIAARAPRPHAPRTPGAPEPPLRLLAVANHRPQKRLERLPTIVAELRRRGRDATLAIVGEPVKNDPVMVAIEGSIREEIARHGLEHHIALEGSTSDVAALYDRHDVVVSTSAFEGLSLVHLEALAAGLPLVTTAVAGSDELARKHAHAHVVPLDASPKVFGAAIVEAEAALATTPARELAPDFTAPKMAERHAELFARLLQTPRGPRAGGLVLVANNFSTGGAQSSGRRLLTTLAAAGVRVRAVVIQEQAAYRTAGRRALEEAGIDVHVAPRAGDVDPLVTARAVAQVVDDFGPDAVLFWNVISQHKVLLADLLLGTRIWDVSPGEMYFTSFDRYFERPRVGSPYLSLRDYGQRLAGVIVKYEGERARAEAALGVAVSVVPNGVLVPATPPEPRRRARTVIGTLARLSPDKKLEQLIDAVGHAVASGHFAACELRIAGVSDTGDAAYVASLHERAKDLPIVWAGEQESSTFLADLDLFAMVSEPSGCPNASLEAMAAGLAVVATDAGGAREQIVHEETGLLVPRGDVAALGDALVRLAADAPRRAELGRAAHARARAQFDVRRMARDYARICLGAVPGPLAAPDLVEPPR